MKVTVMKMSDNRHIRPITEKSVTTDTGSYSKEMKALPRKRIALVTLGDIRREFFATRRGIADEERAKVSKALSERYEVFEPDIVFDIEEGEQTADAIRKLGITCVILHVPIWATPNLSLRVANATELPVLLLGNRRLDSSSLVTLLAIAGLLDQAGKEVIRVAGDMDEEKVTEQIDAFVTACSVRESVRRSSFGMIGGRSIGIGTTVADPSQWQSVFGVEFDHCDQYEIVYRAGALEEERVQLHLNWVKEWFNIQYGKLFTPESLNLQVRSYLALKDMAKEKKYDFLGVKCQPEMSDHFVLQCLGIALLNNDSDAEGDKAPIPTSCECDCDGALTMRILSLCAGGSPSSLVDIKYFDGRTKEFVLANCGSVAPYFANPGNRRGAFSKTTLLPHVFGKAGGASLQLVGCDGPVTVARLYRSKGRYLLGCFEGQMESRPIEELKKTTWCYPHEFIRADIDYDKFFATMNSNHLHTVYGQHLKTLELFCRMAGITFVSYEPQRGI